MIVIKAWKSSIRAASFFSSVKNKKSVKSEKKILINVMKKPT